MQIGFNKKTFSFGGQPPAWVYPSEQVWTGPMWLGAHVVKGGGFPCYLSHKPHPVLWTGRQTDMTEKITFPPTT